MEYGRREVGRQAGCNLGGGREGEKELMKLEG